MTGKRIQQRVSLDERYGRPGRRKPEDVDVNDSKATGHPATTDDATAASGDAEPEPSASAGSRGRASRGDLTRAEIVFWRVLLVVVILGTWEFGSDRLFSSLLASKPSEVGQRFVDWIIDGTLATHFWVTLKATLLGFALGAGSGIFAGYVTGTFKRFGRVVEPAVLAFYTLPRLALAPLFLLWFGFGLQFRVIFAAVIVFFLVYYNTHAGVNEVSRELLLSVRIMGASRWDIAKKVIIPSALVWVAAGFKISVPYALVGVVVAEMIASNQGMGFLLMRSAQTFQARGTFAAVLALLMISLLMDRILSRITGYFLRWRDAEEMPSVGM